MTMRTIRELWGSPRSSDVTEKFCGGKFGSNVAVSFSAGNFDSVVVKGSFSSKKPE